MEKESTRKEAITRHLFGEPIVKICREIGVSRKWFYRWKKRYEKGKEDWYKDHSKVPTNSPNKLDSSMEQLILNVRDKLEKIPYSQIGASAIAWEIHKLGQSPPPYWTVNRVLKRNGRICRKSSSKKGQGNSSYIYFTEGYYPGHLHQADLVGPRHIKGDGRFYSLNTIDIFSHNTYGSLIRSKDDDSIINSLIDTWIHLGTPEFLQLDNEMSFRGSSRYPHSFGKVIKLCLAMNIQLIFIPPGEPWRNGVIERFNNTFDKKLYRTERFKSFEHLKESLRQFTQFHNTRHIYSATGGKTPEQVLADEDIKPDRLDPNYQLPEILRIPDEGYIHFIRYIRSDLKLNIWGERFKMPKKTMYEYVRATVFTQFHLLNVFLGNEVVAQFEYRLPTINQEDPRESALEFAKSIKVLGFDTIFNKES